jgi:hypothetical protein
MMNVPSSFINEDELQETIYMRPPPGYARKPDLVWRLHRLYGLKQAQLTWEQKLRSQVTS